MWCAWTSIQCLPLLPLTATVVSLATIVLFLRLFLFISLFGSFSSSSLLSERKSLHSILVTCAQNVYIYLYVRLSQCWALMLYGLCVCVCNGMLLCMYTNISFVIHLSTYRKANTHTHILTRNAHSHVAIMFVSLSHQATCGDCVSFTMLHQK